MSTGKIKILFTTECTVPFISGSGIATKNLAKGMAGKGHKVALLYPGTSMKQETCNDFNLTMYRLPSVPIPEFLRKGVRVSPLPGIKVKKILESFNPDIIHIEDHMFISSETFHQAKNAGKKIVATNHFTPQNWLYNFIFKKNTKLFEFAEKSLWSSVLKIYNNVDAVTVPSNYARQLIEKAGIKKPVNVISNGVMLEEFSCGPEKNDIFKKYNIDGRRLILLSVSRLDKEKNVGDLLKALSLLKGSMDFSFIITGQGKDYENLQKITEVMDLTGNVVFTGIVPYRDLKKLYMGSDIFLTASGVELQGLSIMEAMASCLPVVAANAMAIPELVKDGVNGFLFEPGNHKKIADIILELANNKKLREKMGAKSFEIIKEHSFEKILDKYESVYYGLL